MYLFKTLVYHKTLVANRKTNDHNLIFLLGNDSTAI